MIKESEVSRNIYAYLQLRRNFFAKRASPTSSKLLKGFFAKISSEGRGPEPPCILVHLSLFCLAMALVRYVGKV